MDRCVGAAARLPESDRKDLAVQALARSATISDLSSRHGVSRKFVYQQADKARRALDDAFISADADDEMAWFRIGCFWVTNWRAEAAGHCRPDLGRLGYYAGGRRPASPVQACWF